MTDQQRLRDALANAVPDPPDEPRRGAAARTRARTTRRRNVVVAGGVALAVVVAGVGVATTHHQSSGPTVTGSGAAACRRLTSMEKPERFEDSRVVDGATAADWLGHVRTDLDPAAYRDDDRVTVCVTSWNGGYAVYVVDQSGRSARVTSGGYGGAGGIQWTMTRLDRRVTGGRTTTDAPFDCPSSTAARYPDVSTSLPTGATAAKICFGGEFFTPHVTLTRNVDTLVREVNAAPISYSTPNFNCSGADGDYGFTLVFQYPTGTRMVSEETCRGLAIGPYTRAARVSLDPLYRSLLVEQAGIRAGSVGAPPCPQVLAERPQGVGDIREIVAARYCPTRAGGGGPVLSAGQLRQLRTWGRFYVGATTQPDDPTGTCSQPATGWPRLSLADAWGDYFTVVLVGCGRRIFPEAVNWSARDKVIYPLSSDNNTLARLARLLARQSP